LSVRVSSNCTALAFAWLDIRIFGNKDENKWLCHERLCPENKVLYLMFYYELKLYWMKICWLYERS
jgi:hypothetical protein